MTVSPELIKNSDLGGYADGDAGDNCSYADISPATERNPTSMCDSVCDRRVEEG